MSPPLSPGGRGAYKAFTLIELLTVIAIIGVLAGITFGVVRGVGEQAKINRAIAEQAVIANGLEAYKQYYGDYPWVGRDSAPDQITPDSSPASDSRAYNLFRALGGRLAPRRFAGDLNSDGLDDSIITRQVKKNGQLVAKYARSFVDFTLLTMERKEVSDAPSGILPLPLSAASSTDPDPDFANAFLDPWGNRYLYYYKNLPPPATNPGAWKSPSYVLFSAGPDGQMAYSATDKAAGNLPDSSNPLNSDNIYARP